VPQRHVCDGLRLSFRKLALTFARLPTILNSHFVRTK
jgi:hypothetical protein